MEKNIHPITKEELKAVIDNISSLETLELATVNIYLFLKNEKIDVNLAFEIMISVLSNNFFIELLGQGITEDKHQYEIRSFLQLSLVWFLRLFSEEDLHVEEIKDETNMKRLKSLVYHWEEEFKYNIALSRIIFRLIEILQENVSQSNFTINLSDFFVAEDKKIFSYNLKLKCNSLAIIFLHWFIYDLGLKEQLQNTVNHMGNKEKKPNIIFSFNRIYGVINKINWWIKWQIDYWTKKNMWRAANKCADFFFNENDRLSYEIINTVVSDMPHEYIEGFNFGDSMMKKMDILIQKECIISEIVSQKLQNFNKLDIGYVDKIVFATFKLISVLKNIVNSKNDKWKVTVIVREFFQWIDEVHNIVNKYELIDDWENIRPYLQAEDDEIEWKSSFVMPLENPNPKFKTENLEKIAETIVAMMNTKWWSIIVGYVEKKDNILDKYKDFIFQRNDFYFFDIKYEFSQFRIDIDEISRTIQDNIKSDLKSSINSFDSLFRIHEININIKGQDISLYKIIIEKSDKFYYSVSKDGNYLTLRKRVKGRNELVLPDFDITSSSSNSHQK